MYYSMWEDAGLQENTNCSETYAVFCLSGKQLNIEVITQTLGIEADFTELETCSEDIKQVLLGEYSNFWAISSQNHLSTTSLEKHLIFLLNQLELVGTEVIHLIDQVPLSATFHCFWINESFLGGPVLSAGVMRRIADLRSFLKFEFF